MNLCIKKSVFCFSLCLVLLCTACGNQNKNVSIKDFVEFYSSFSPDENYYKENDYDYKSLYDIKLEKATTKSYDTYKTYDFTLSVSLFSKTAVLFVNTDLNDNVYFAEVMMTTTNYETLFLDENYEFSFDEVYDYFAVVAEGVTGVPAKTLKKEHFPNVIKHSGDAIVYKMNEKWQLCFKYDEDNEIVDFCVRERNRNE